MPRNSPFGPQTPNAQVLKIIRAAMAAGPLLLAGLALVKRYQGTAQPSDPAALGTIRVAAYVFCLGALAAVLVIRGMRAGKEPAQRASLSLIAWSVCEAAALLGGVFMFLGGEPWPFATGMLVLIFAWVQIPADPDVA
jgi:peptidoglycan/LPS O-acetylase OafA/YrhL